MSKESFQAEDVPKVMCVAELMFAQLFRDLWHKRGVVQESLGKYFSDYHPYYLITI